MLSFSYLLSGTLFQSTPSASVVAIRYADVYPIFLSQLLCSRVREQVQLQRIDLPTYDLDAFILAAQTTFLGQTFWYWITGVDELSEKKRALFFRFLQSYSGPHTLIVWTSSPVSGVDSVEIPEQVQKDHIEHLLSLVVIDGNPAKTLVTQAQRMLLQYKKLSIEQALQLLVYVVVAASDREQVFKEWGNALVHVDQSLFTLSQHLLAKNRNKFRELYDTMTASFQDTFWISFWADQIWRAIHVIDAYAVKDFATAKAHGARLPFSFMNTDWRKYTAKELTTLHDLLYTFDYQLKNGVEPQLDLFYLSFFK